MRSSEADGSDTAWGLDELKLLAALGFGPDSALMNEPKLLVDRPFLAALQQELETELGPDEASRTLYHIGVIHGLRDAARIGGAEPGRDGRVEVVEYPPLVMRFGAGVSAGEEAEGFEMAGAWPDAFEAEARLSRLGTAPHPACALSAGYTSGWLSGTLERDVRVEELRCRAAGDDACSFVARDERHDDDRLRGLPVAALRGVALAGPNPSGHSRHDAVPIHMDPGDPAVHIWGPVMVMPFTGPDEAVRTVEMLAQDEATRGVRVVVLDLCGGLLDAGFGAAALERVIEELQSWGAEVVLTGISPLSEDVVAELQASLMLARKDLAEAIAYAFQIADAQRFLV